MPFVVVVLLKGLIGGVLVVAFALTGEVVRPRGLAGISSAAPSVALAGLAITVLTTGDDEARLQALGMGLGAAALVVFCLFAAESVKRLGGLKGSLVATAVWWATAFSLFAVIR